MLLSNEEIFVLIFRLFIFMANFLQRPWKIFLSNNISLYKNVFYLFHFFGKHQRRLLLSYVNLDRFRRGFFCLSVCASIYSNADKYFTCKMDATDVDFEIINWKVWILIQDRNSRLWWRKKTLNIFRFGKHCWTLPC
jgi:hypothetical protein